MNDNTFTLALLQLWNIKSTSQIRLQMKKGTGENEAGELGSEANSSSHECDALPSTAGSFELPP